MNRIRMLGTFFLICNVVIFFLPELYIRQENYPEQVFSQFSFARDCFLSASANTEPRVSANMRILVFLFIILPLMASIVCGIAGFIERVSGRYIAVGTIVTGLLYFVHFLVADQIWPVRLNNAQSYDRGIGWWLLAVSMAGTLFTGIWQLVISGRKTVVEADIMPEEQETEQPVLAQNSAEDIIKEISGESRGAFYTPYADRAEDYTASQTQTQLEVNMPLTAFPEQAVQEPGEQEVNRSRGVMLGISGVFQGAEIAMKSGEAMNLGRDLSNDLVFQDAPHVSRSHCAIIWQAERQKYMIEDWSSNGCFINGALERLPKNVPVVLEPGTVVDIGDRTNRFRLE